MLTETDNPKYKAPEILACILCRFWFMQIMRDKQVIILCKSTSWHPCCNKSHIRNISMHVTAVSVGAPCCFCTTINSTKLLILLFKLLTTSKTKARLLCSDSTTPPQSDVNLCPCILLFVFCDHSPCSFCSGVHTLQMLHKSTQSTVIKRGEGEETRRRGENMNCNESVRALCNA